MKNGIVVHAVRGVGGAGGDERRHRAGLGDALFENLAVLRFAVVEQRVRVDRLVELADVRIDADLAEQRVHAERARLVGDDRHDALADLLVAQQLRQQARRRPSSSRPCGRRCPCENSSKSSERRRLRAASARDLRLGSVAAQRLAALAAGTSSRGCRRRAGRTASSRRRSSESGMPKRLRKARSSSSFIFFCWWVMFLPSPASPRP